MYPSPTIKTLWVVFSSSDIQNIRFQYFQIYPSPTIKILWVVLNICFNLLKYSSKYILFEYIFQYFQIYPSPTILFWDTVSCSWLWLIFYILFVIENIVRFIMSLKSCNIDFFQVYLAHCFPYRYSDLAEDLAR